MAGLTADIATGMTVAATSWTFGAEILSFNHSGISGEAVPTSHMGTAAAAAGKFGNATFIPGEIIDPGELSLTVHVNTEQNTTTTADMDLPPVGLGTSAIVFTFPAATTSETAATWTSNGICTSYDMSGELDGVITADMTIKLSGNVTVAAAS